MAQREFVTASGMHISFLFDTVSDSGKTKIWSVVAKENWNDFLGEVRWIGQWRCYGFFPSEGSRFEKTCLRDIANFCEDQTKQHRNVRRHKEF